jgi:hypothetical protein
MTRGRSLLVAALLIASLTGCQALPGPLDYGNGGATICAPATTSSPWLIGDSFNTGDTEVHIQSVELEGGAGIELEGAWLTASDVAIGAVSYPPRPDLHWEDAVPAVGATIAPHTEQAIAFLVRPTGSEKGTAVGVALTYSIGLFTYRDVGSVSIRLEVPCS